MDVPKHHHQSLSACDNRYARPASKNTPECLQRSLSTSSNSDTYDLRAGARQNIVNDHCQHLITEIQTTCPSESNNASKCRQ
ncbi:hypothetical protein M408DRAFT_266123 [Serendipita vermifera MAFF 305830]|uniref:Uncharacterized protein n=1 Tax=Serendipita vermifera MAFF 305830 TaxID=933852 RepID=A0A0C2W9Q1_SERVB|nr:hypothetical protein M408DRAFT_266123 [Serendipita vermifera MAFF 305830]